MKKIYLGLNVDIIEQHHFNMIEQAVALGELTIGLLTDDLIFEQNKSVNYSYEQRKSIIKNFREVINIVAQDSWDLSFILNSIKPDFITYNDDCFVGLYYKIKTHALNIIKQWGGEWINLASVSITNKKQTGITPNKRLGYLRKLLNTKLIIRVLEVHNGLTGLIVENLKVHNSSSSYACEFDAMWSSSLTDSTAKGKPDIEIVDLTSRLITVNDIFDVTTKPLIFDADTGGNSKHFVFAVKTIERLGVSAIIVEDKIGLKKNSLLGNEVLQVQASCEEFCQKIIMGKQAQVTKDFMIIARIESLILEKGINDALKRAKSYIDAGADAIMIHSRKKEPDEIFNFCEQFYKLPYQVPLVVAPTSYNKVTESQLISVGIKIVIYANHMLRAAYPNMIKVAKSILNNSTSAKCESDCMSISEILELIPGTK